MGRGRIIGLTGFAQSGKDTAASFLVDRGWTRIAFADILRQSLYNLNPIIDTTVHVICDDDYVEDADVEHERVQQIVDRAGWDVAKVRYPEIRQLLQRLGTEVGRELYGEDFWVESALKQIKRRFALVEVGSDERRLVVEGNYVITDVRFPNEEVAVHRLGGHVFRIERAGTEAVNAHASEAHVLSMPVDGVIVNPGDDLAAYEAEVLRVTRA